MQIIKSCQSLQEANIFFCELRFKHSVISEKILENSIELSPSLKKFLRDFKHINDDELKAYYFDQIQKNQYSLDHETVIIIEKLKKLCFFLKRLIKSRPLVSIPLDEP